MNLQRATIDNDMYKIVDWREKYFLYRQQEQCEGFRVQQQNDNVKVEIHTHFSLLSQAFGFKGIYTYVICPDGELVLILR